MMMRAWLLAAVILAGCAYNAKHYQAPSTAPVQAGINRAKSGTEEARVSNQAIARGNQEARTLSQRIHDKDILIDRWRETHPNE